MMTSQGFKYRTLTGAAQSLDTLQLSMKTAAAVLLLTLGLFFIHVDALKCRQSSCTGIGPCTTRTVTCRDDMDHCFVMMKTYPTVVMNRGCIKESNCQIMKAYETSTRCCKFDLCN